MSQLRVEMPASSGVIVLKETENNRSQCGISRKWVEVQCLLEMVASQFVFSLQYVDPREVDPTSGFMGQQFSSLGKVCCRTLPISIELLQPPQLNERDVSFDSRGTTFEGSFQIDNRSGRFSESPASSTTEYVAPRKSGALGDTCGETDLGLTSPLEMKIADCHCQTGDEMFRLCVEDSFKVLSS